MHRIKGRLINTSTSTSILAGPVVRHCDKFELNFWLVTTTPSTFTCSLYVIEEPTGISTDLLHVELLNKPDVDKTDEEKSQLQQCRIGTHAYINLITLRSSESFPENVLIEYDILANYQGNVVSVTQLPRILYDNQKRPSIVIKPTIKKVLHGSCRKPHFNSKDGLLQVDYLLATTDFSASERPTMLMMSGDQIYVDDVAGPTLVAIHQVIEQLGLFDETWESEYLTSSQALYNNACCYYQRKKILPTHKTFSLFNKERINPIFTSVQSDNHLITVSEVLAMYLLSWSPVLWERVSIDEVPPGLAKVNHTKYLHELATINSFTEGLHEVRRSMAHIPVYMIFDDHDITDDWNLTRGWEEAAYTNDFSKQIIGNALIGYWLCQGWGNAPKKFTSLIDEIGGLDKVWDLPRLSLIALLLDWEQWNYTLATLPKTVVLDTRTQRWRSESTANKPSGLMDWETLSDFQQELIKQPSVIVVSAAPIYGVKLIETIQRVFTFFGKPLTVDAENWMAHSGTANVILNIFRNPKTPPNFIILSGDVHYSFVYEVSHRFRKSSAKILQVTSSGIKNKFPEKLLNILEILNRVLYATYSPLNWFTKRRSMKIRVRKPDTSTNKHLYNGSGIGVLFLKENDEVITQVITSTGKTVNFEKYDSDKEASE